MVVPGNEAQLDEVVVIRSSGSVAVPMVTSLSTDIDMVLPSYEEAIKIKEEEIADGQGWFVLNTFTVFEN